MFQSKLVRRYHGIKINLKADFHFTFFVRAGPDLSMSSGLDLASAVSARKLIGFQLSGAHSGRKIETT